MLDLLRRKVDARHLKHKITAANAQASEILHVQNIISEGQVRVAYSFNGALNCEQDIERVPSQLSKIIKDHGYFLCSIRNTLCLSEAISHTLLFQFARTNGRKLQPTMVSVGGMDIPAYYYSPNKFVNLFRPYFQAKKIIGLPTFLPPAYLSNHFIQTGKAGHVLEKFETILSDKFPFNRFGDQTLFVFQKE